MRAGSARTRGADIGDDVAAGSSSRTIYFVRHGRTEWNAVQRMQGRWNSDLDELGRRQADANGRLLEGVGIERIFSSPLERTRQTTEIIGRYVDAPVTYDERIVEWDCGDWSGHLRSEVVERWPEEYAAFLADPFHYRGPSCENFPDMFERARPFVEELLALDSQRIVVVSHGMIGKVMVSILLGLDEDETLAIHQPNDAVFRLRLGAEEPEVHHWRAGVGPVVGLTGWES
ncbi:MAG: histidine phosphatase family protein [Gemmatimonadota bacterium]|jgi:broad specificity phosphatase PhoE